MAIGIQIQSLWPYARRKASQPFALISHTKPRTRMNIITVDN